MSEIRYSVTLTSPLDRTLNRLCRKLGRSRADVFRMALELLDYAVDADEVHLITNGETQNVLVK